MPYIDDGSVSAPSPEEIAMNDWLEDTGPYMTLPEPAASDGWLDLDDE